MSGPSPGLDFGPFPQNVASFKRRSTNNLTDQYTDDPEIFFKKNKRLVEGFYEVSGRLLCNRPGVVAASIRLGFTFDNDTIRDAVEINATAGRANQDTVQDVNAEAWVGDGDATVQLSLPQQDDTFVLPLGGIVFIPAPTNCTLRWRPNAADPAGVNMFAGSILRLSLVR